MADRPVVRPRGSLPRGLLGLIALVLAVEAVVARYESVSLTTVDRDDWGRTARAARRASAPGGTLCFGDSLVKFGIAPAVLRARTGRPARNLAACGGPPAFAYLMLRRALARSRPVDLVIELTPSSLVMPPGYYLSHWQALATAGEALDLAWSTRDAGLFGHILTGRLLPTFRDRHPIRALLRRAVAGRDPYEADARTLAAWRRNARRNLGGFLLPAPPPRPIEVDPTNKSLFPDFWVPDPAEAGYATRLLELAAASGARTYLLLPPYSPATRALYRRRGLDALQALLARQVQSRFPGLVVLDARRSGYPDAAFADMVHLNRRGAVALSAALGDVLRDGRRGDPRRWVELPPYREPTSRVALEDLGQSEVAWAASARARR